MASESVGRAVLEIVTDTTKYFSGLNEAGKGATKFGDQMKQATQPTSAFGSQLGSVTSVVGKFAGALGISLGAGAIVGFAQHVVDVASRIGDLSAKLGVSTEFVQRMSYAAGQSGISIETVNTAVAKMNEMLSSGDKATIEALKKVGLSFDTIRAMKPEEAFYVITDAIKGVEDPMTRAEVAVRLFGRSGQDMLPMILDGVRELGEGTNVMSDETIRQLKAAGDAWQSLKDRVVTYTGQMIGAELSAHDQRQQDIDDMSKAAQSGKTLEQVYRDQIDANLKLIDTSGQLHSPMAALGPVVKSATDAEQEFTESNKQNEAQLRKNIAALEAHNARVHDLADQISGRRLASQVRDVADALALVGGAAKLSAPQTAELVKMLQGFVEKGATLPPILEDIYIKSSIASSVFPSMANGLKSISAVAVSAGKSLHDFIPPLKEIVSQDIRNVLDFGKITPAQLHVDAPAKGASSAFSKNFSETMQKTLPTNIMAAITGGGNVFQTIGSTMGGFLVSNDGFGKKITGQLTKMLPDGLAKSISSMLPGVGALMGPLVSKIAGAIASAFGGNSTKSAREDFAKSMGLTLDGLMSKLQGMGAEGQRLANQALNVIGKHDEAANKAWMAEVSKFLDDTKKKEEDLAAASAESFRTAQSSIGSALGSVIKGTIGSQAEFDRLSRIALNTFETLVKSGVAPVEAMSQIGEAVDVLIGNLATSGMQGNAAFEQLSRWRTLTSANAPLLEQVGSLNSLMQFTTTLGGMNADAFADMQAQGLAAYNQLLAAGFTESEARAQLKPLLEQEIQLNKDKGYAIDEATQKIIAQGIANGDLSAEQLSTNDILMQGIGALITALGGDLPEAWTKAAKSATEAGTTINNGWKSVAVESVHAVSSALSGLVDDFSGGFDVPITFDIGDLPGANPIPMADGGFGRVTEPTLFLAGEGGPEDYAFSGGWQHFGGGGFGGADHSAVLQGLRDDIMGLSRALRTEIPMMAKAWAKAGAQGLRA